MLVPVRSHVQMLITVPGVVLIHKWRAWAQSKRMEQFDRPRDNQDPAFRSRLFFRYFFWGGVVSNNTVYEAKRLAFNLKPLLIVDQA